MILTNCTLWFTCYIWAFLILSGTCCRISTQFFRAEPTVISITHLFPFSAASSSNAQVSSPHLVDYPPGLWQISSGWHKIHLSQLPTRPIPPNPPNPLMAQHPPHLNPPFLSLFSCCRTWGVLTMHFLNPSLNPHHWFLLGWYDMPGAVLVMVRLAFFGFKVQKYFASVWVCDREAYQNEKWNESEKLCVCVLVLCIFFWPSNRASGLALFGTMFSLQKGVDCAFFRYFSEFFDVRPNFLGQYFLYHRIWGIGSCKSLHWVLNMMFLR